MHRSAQGSNLSTAIAVLAVIIAASTALIFYTGGTEKIFAFKGGYLINSSDYGDNTRDIPNSVVIVKGDRIVAAGSAESVKIPGGAEVIDITGKYILPGLIDGFAAINNQAYANAYLYMGITTIISVDGGRRGPLFTKGDPGPDIYQLESIAGEAKSTAELIKDMESLAELGKKVILIMYQARSEQLKPIVTRAEELGLVTIGEMGYASYRDGIKAGVHAFVHTTRYSLNLAPPEMQRNVADNPFSDDLDSHKWIYYKWLNSISPESESLRHHAEVLASGKTALIPTHSLLYLDKNWSENPWNEEVTGILHPADIHRPADRETGRHTDGEEHMAAYSNLAISTMVLEKEYVKAGAQYLAGSGTDVWGTMPGISLHTELECLNRAGLSARQIIAAATGNFAETFGWNIGRIAPDYKAHLIVLNKNPLEDIKNLKDISILMLNGKMIDRKELLQK